MSMREVDLTLPQRQLLRRILREEAQRLGYGEKYHDVTCCESGPDSWPQSLVELNKIMRKLGRG